MYLYNSLTHKKELFVPNNPELVKMYTCGPTVYHLPHIGNLRTYIMEDVLGKVPALSGISCQAGHEHHGRGSSGLQRGHRRGQDGQGSQAGSTRPSWKLPNTTPMPSLPTATS